MDREERSRDRRERIPRRPSTDSPMDRFFQRADSDDLAGDPNTSPSPISEWSWAGSSISRAPSEYGFDTAAARARFNADGPLDSPSDEESIYEFDALTIRESELSFKSDVATVRTRSVANTLVSSASQASATSLRYQVAAGPVSKGKEAGAVVIDNSSEFQNPSEYTKALEALRLKEKQDAFNAHSLATSSETEKVAASLVKKINHFDLDNTYGSPFDANGHPTGKRNQGDHFLGNVDLINRSELMKIARRLPKGAHLRQNFYSCLPARYLIRQARDINAMYIRSTLPLTSAKNLADSKISFMVMTYHEATHTKDVDGREKYVPLGDVWAKDYISHRWMLYKRFLLQFNLRDDKHGDLLRTPGAETWLESKMLISEEEAHGTYQNRRGIWEKADSCTQMIEGLFTYESAFRNYTRELIWNFVRDNIQYAEVRLNLKDTTLRTDDGTGLIGSEGIIMIIKEELQETMEQIRTGGKNFQGLRVIYCAPRSIHKVQMKNALDECIDLKQRFPRLLCGFDLVGNEELGHELTHFVPEFLEFRKKCISLGLDIPFLFNCGNTLGNGDHIDDNLFHAVLLGSRRIGHGYTLARHSFLMKTFKQKKIAVESCPISDEVLGLTHVTMGHYLHILLANDVPCTINSDNPTFYRSSLSHDFYQVMIGSESVGLLGWKQLAEWSLEHSCMGPEELRMAIAEWTRRWDEFCQWIVDEYGPKLDYWEPGPAR